MSVIVFGVTALAGKLGDSTKGAVDARAGVMATAFVRLFILRL